MTVATATALSMFAWTPAHAKHLDKLTIAAANSTCTAIKAVGAAFTVQSNIKMEYICKSSGRLAKGLKGGAITAHYYISANAKWMDDMVDAGLVQRSAVKSHWGNELVVAAPQGSSLQLTALSDLISDKVENVFIGDPSTAPFGRYAKQALVDSGVWEVVKLKTTTQKHVTLLAKNLAQANSGAVGILFSTNLTPNLHPLFTIEQNLHDPIHYFSGPLVTAESQKHVKTFSAFLTTETAQRLFRERGFKILQ